MEINEAIKTRKSYRKFLTREVPRKIIEEVVSDAMHAPSYRNSQPWEVVAISGLKKEELSRMLIDLLERAVKPQPDIPEATLWPDIQTSRMKDTALKRSAAYGIVAGDPNAMKNSKIANFSFYGAPVGIFFFHDASLGLWSILDFGMFIENIMLGFYAKGIATVPQAYLIDYSPQVKQFLEIPDSKRLVLGMSVGFPDLDDPRAKFTSDRAPLEEIFRWIE